MVYNPIFEEEIERKRELQKLKKEIKTRHRKENLKQVFDRLYNLFQKKPILTIYSLFHPLLNRMKTTSTKEA